MSAFFLEPPSSYCGSAPAAEAATGQDALFDHEAALTSLLQCDLDDQDVLGRSVLNALFFVPGRETASLTYATSSGLEKRSQGGVTWMCAYNDMGVLSQVGGPNRAHYFYDGLGRRVKVEGPRRPRGPSRSSRAET